MDHYVVAGDPVEHSQSPFIHAAFAQQTGEALDYGRLRVPPGTFRSALQTLGAGGAKGCNVTVPYKFEAFEAASQRTDRATLAQAANTLRRDADGWHADNTDGIGLVRDIEQHAGSVIAGRRVLLIGAGGAAAGALGPLLAARPAELVVANRTLATALALVERHRRVAGTTALQAAPLGDCGAAFDLVINASSSSLAGAGVPVGGRVLGSDALAVDLMYGPAAHAFLAWAEAHGARARDGLGMLVEQAAAAFEFWRGVRPATAPVLAALRQRLAGGVS